MGEMVFMVVESSEAGEHIVGVFTSLARAREVLPGMDSGRLQDFRIEYQALDQPLDQPTPWQVSLRRDGSFIGVEPIIACACCDEQQSVAQASFIEAGGELARLAVWAKTPGAAIATARSEAQRLVEAGVWDTSLRYVEPVHAEALAAQST